MGGEPLRVRYAGSRCTSEESKSGRDGYDPGESRILLNIARALNFLPIKPPASPTPISFSSSTAPFRPRRRRSPPPSMPCTLIPRRIRSHHLYSRPSLVLSRSLNLIRSLPARLPKPSGVGYSVTVHERRLISIPATPPSPSLPSRTAHGETSPDLRRCRGTCGKSLAGFRNAARLSLLSSLKSHQLCRMARIEQAAMDSSVDFAADR